MPVLLEHEMAHGDGGHLIKDPLLKVGDCLEFVAHEEEHKLPLNHFCEEETFYAICHALKSADHEVSTGAALVLGRIKDKRALPFLLSAMLTTNVKKAQAIAWALGELKDPRATPFLVEALSQDFIAKSAIVALGKIGSLDSLDILLRSLKHRDENQRALVVKAIGQLSYGNHYELKSKTVGTLMRHLAGESSRTVRLAICVISARLEKF